MTLSEALARQKTMPQVGDHEVVIGPDGLGHMLVITAVHDVKGVSERSVANLNFMCPCQVINSGDPGSLEVAPSITCFTCIQW